MSNGRKQKKWSRFFSLILLLLMFLPLFLFQTHLINIAERVRKTFIWSHITKSFTQLHLHREHDLIDLFIAMLHFEMKIHTKHYSY